MSNPAGCLPAVTWISSSRKTRGGMRKSVFQLLRFKYTLPYCSTTSKCEWFTKFEVVWGLACLAKLRSRHRQEWLYLQEKAKILHRNQKEPPADGKYPRFCASQDFDFENKHACGLRGGKSVYDFIYFTQDPRKTNAPTIWP
ncbi:hypothetical protein EAF04_008402 [Stromatinia cepivora]|nr:hypothetical protein EAF04_008402 [Stromatinia cepivora]